MSLGTPDGPAQLRFSPHKEGAEGISRPGRPGQAQPPPPEAFGEAQSATEEAKRVSPQAPVRRSTQGLEPPAAAEGRSIAGSIRRLEQRLGSLTTPGEGGARRVMGPLFFDPQGADFTGWSNHWSNEVFRNWILPQSVIFGFSHGDVILEFTVERDGTLSDLRLIRSSGVRALDRAAENALLSSRLLPLPADYRPPRVTITVAFTYESPQGS